MSTERSETVERFLFPMRVTNAEVWVLKTYRALRSLGFQRSEANYLVMGIVMGTGAADLEGGPLLPVEPRVFGEDGATP